MRVLKQLILNLVIIGVVVSAFILMNYNHTSAPVFRASREGVVALRCSIIPEDFNLHFVLNELSEQNAHMTFFADEKWIKENQGECNEIISEGHEIGVLGKSEKPYESMSFEEIYDEMVKTKQRIQTSTGFTPTVFSPYAGDYNDSVLNAAKKAKMQTVLWSIEPVALNTSRNESDTEQSVVSMRVQNVKPGDIINLKPEALHDLHAIVEWLSENNLQPVTVGQLLFEK